MENWYGAQVCEEARQRSRGEEKQKLSAIYAGALAGAALVVTLLQLLLDNWIGNTGGLSGLGMRSLLQTAGTVLSAANSLLSPFWTFGFCFVTLLWARQQSARPGDLLEGFRRFGPYLRLLLNRLLILIAACFLCAYVSAFLYMLTPWSAPVVEFAQSVGADMTEANAAMAQMEAGQLDSLMQAMTPMLVIWGVLALAVAVPLLYRFRMAEYLLLDDRRMGTLHAMVLSAGLLRKRCRKLFLLDLRFWWYYALELACLGLFWADWWLPLLGVQLPDGIGTMLILYLAYLLCLFALQTLLRPQVQTAYALAYEKLLQLTPQEPQTAPKPGKLPWDEQ